MKQLYLLIGSFLFIIPLHAQLYSDYLGAGHSNGITVTSSSNQNSATAVKTIDGSGMDNDKMEAARFLAQATFGFDMGMVEELTGNDFEEWIDEQIDEPTSNFSEVLDEVYTEVYDLLIASGYTDDDIGDPRQIHYNYSWWTLHMTKPDLLRQKMAYALHQILVVSNNSDLRGRAEAMTSYYDILLEHAFGNFEDILLDVTLHPSMGYYLSHLNNPKADPQNNVHPDENYAREIMQLFSIGLYELNIDGSRKLDGNGDPIPTYDNNDIKEFAKIFTGLGPGAINENVTWTNDPYFGLGIWGADLTVPMVMYQDFHETSEKNLLDGYTVPAGQDGITDIEQTVNHLFNHPNVGPFLAIRLIQRLITSNPTPGYITRVAETFNNNGNGVRGDMEAVIKAILLDEEAREGAAMMSSDHGRLKEPVIRAINIAKSLEYDSPLGRYWHNGYSLSSRLKQFPGDAPSVFNWYNPDHAPNGPVSNNDLVAPEFKIHNTSTSIQYVNKVNQWVVNETLWWSWHGNQGDPNVDFVSDGLDPLAENMEELLNYLDILYCYGQMSDDTRETIKENAIQFNTNSLHNRVRISLYLLLLSPDFTVMK